MKILNALRIGTLFLGIVLTPFFTYAEQNHDHDRPENKREVYAQLFSNKTQLPSTADNSSPPNSANFSSFAGEFEKTHSISGLKVKDNNKVLIEENGTYVVSTQAQVGSERLPLLGTVMVAITKNGHALHYSNRAQNINQTSLINSIGSQIVLELKKGDVIGVEISSNSPLLGVIAHPSFTSVALSIFKL